MIDLSDPRALRAVAHPLRLALIGLLRQEGPLTATQAAARLKETPQRCTYHLSHLAKFGLVEEAGGGRGRERPWRATAALTHWSSVPEGPEMAAAAEMLESVLVRRYFESASKWVRHKPTEPGDWQEAAQFGDRILFLTAEELTRLGDEIWRLVDGYCQRGPDARPAGSRAVSLTCLAFPSIWPGDEQ